MLLLLAIAFAVVGPAGGVCVFNVVGDGECDARWAFASISVMVMMALVFFTLVVFFVHKYFDGVVCFSR